MSDDKVVEGKVGNRRVRRTKTNWRTLEFFPRTGLQWSKEEDHALEVLWSSHSPTQIAQYLQRTPESVKRRASTLGLTARVVEKENRWTKKELEELRELSYYIPLWALAQVVGRSVEDIESNHVVRKHLLVEQYRTAEELARRALITAANTNSYSYSSVARYLGVSPELVELAFKKVQLTEAALGTLVPAWHIAMRLNISLEDVAKLVKVGKLVPARRVGYMEFFNAKSRSLSSENIRRVLQTDSTD